MGDLRGPDGNAVNAKEAKEEKPKVMYAVTVCWHDDGNVSIAPTAEHAGESYIFVDEKGRITSPTLAEAALRMGAELVSKQMLLSMLSGYLNARDPHFAKHLIGTMVREQQSAVIANRVLRPK